MKSQIFFNKANLRSNTSSQFALLYSWFPLQKYRVQGHSMEPLFFEGQTVIINKYSYTFQKPQLRDCVIVQVYSSKKIVLKRITKIKNNNIYLEGDNKHDSMDSKEFGWIEKKQIIGKVIFISSKVKT